MILSHSSHSERIHARKMRRPLFVWLFIFFFWKIDYNFSFSFRREVKCCRNVHIKLITLETQLRTLTCFGSKNVFGVLLPVCSRKSHTCHSEECVVWLSRECWVNDELALFLAQGARHSMTKSHFVTSWRKKPHRFFYVHILKIVLNFTNHKMSF